MGRLLSRAVAIFFSILFIIISSLSACTTAFRSSLVDVDTYKETLVEQNVYQDIIPYIVPVMLENRETQLNTQDDLSIALSDIANFMSLNDWRRVSDELIPPAWLQAQTESFLNSIDLISQGNFSQLNNVADLSEVIDRLQGEEGTRASEIIIDASPECDAQQVIQLRQLNTGRGTVFPICQPPATLRETSVDAVATWFDNLGAIIAQVRDNNTVTIPEDAARLIFNIFKLDSQIAFLFLLCPLSLIGLIMLFAVRNLKGFGRWLGWTFILSGIFTLLLIFISQGPVFASFNEVVGASSDIERFEAQIYAGFIRSVYVDASGTMLIISGFMIIVGFILLIISLRDSKHFLIPEGSVLVTEDGRIVSATQPQRKTVILPKDKS